MATIKFKADKFQVEALEGIKRDENVIVCAPTGSGKTFIATESIKYSLERDSKGIVIYTTPIKALSRQKFNDLSELFPDVRVGKLTGDEKINPDAQLLVMTTEIYNQITLNGEVRDDDMNLVRTLDKNNIKLVIYDEAHYIADAERGFVWNDSITRSQCNKESHTQLLLLSASLYNPVGLQRWIQRLQTKYGLGKKCTLTVHTERPIPLNHYMYHSSTNKYNKMCKEDLSLPRLYNDGKLTRIMNGEDGVVERVVMKDFLTSNNLVKSKKEGVNIINDLTNMMSRDEKLPAIFFLLSCDGCKNFALKCKGVLKEQDDNVKAIEELNKIIVSLSGYENFKVLRESKSYKELKECVEKGVGYHHSGLHPTFKEAVEQLFLSGHIEIVFATETFSVGINFPARTVIFMSLWKYDGSGNYNPLEGFTYHQMAGRAGRRGYDTEGNVIIVPNSHMWPSDMAMLRSENKRTLEKYASSLAERQSQIVRSMLKISTKDINLQFNVTLSMSLEAVAYSEKGKSITRIANLCGGHYSFRDVNLSSAGSNFNKETKRYNKLIKIDRQYLTREDEEWMEILHSSECRLNNILKEINEDRAFVLRDNVTKHHEHNVGFLRNANYLDENDNVTKKGEAFLLLNDSIDRVHLIEFIVGAPLDDKAKIILSSLYLRSEMRNSEKTEFMRERTMEKYNVRDEFMLNSGTMNILVSSLESEEHNDIFTLANTLEIPEGKLIKILLTLRKTYVELSAMATVLEFHTLASEYKEVSVKLCKWL